MKQKEDYEPIKIKLIKLYSLKEWHDYETNNQDFFSGMYQFWLEKKQENI